MRILVAGPLDAGDAAYREVDKYRSAGHDVVVNHFYFPDQAAGRLVARYRDDPHVAFRCFDPGDPDSLRAEITRGNIGYHAITYPPDLGGFTSDVVVAATDGSIANPLRVVGCPNDVKRHLGAVEGHGVAVENSSEIHGRAVAEYTLCQIGFHVRRIGWFYHATGENGAWPHDQATPSTSSLAGKTIGVIGAAGKDGGAVARLAMNMGLRVVGIGDGSAAGNAKMRAMGLEVAPNFNELLNQADFLSINSAKDRTLGLIGPDQFRQMKRGVVIVNPAGAEIIDKAALFAEFVKPPHERVVGTVIFDMPYGGRRGDKTFSFDTDNARLKSLGVLFTPRMAGYTVDTYRHGIDEVAEAIISRLPRNSAAANVGELDTMALARHIVVLVRRAAESAIELRTMGLITRTKQDGSPSTNADRIAEEIIRDGLIRRGYDCSISGEELGEVKRSNGGIEVIIDGIDGTRNFRDGNYGWCTSVCVRKAAENVIGVVHDPVCQETYWAVRGKGAFRSGEILTEALKTPEKLPADFSFSIGSFRIQGSKAIKNRVAEDITDLGGHLREWGSIALSICAVARGGLGAFIQWNSDPLDHAGALVIAAEAGAGVSCGVSDEPGRENVLVGHPALIQFVEGILRPGILRQGGPGG
jgi:myo-inositol-1(or 4)-monophosphatase